MVTAILLPLISEFVDPITIIAIHNNLQVNTEQPFNLADVVDSERFTLAVFVSDKSILAS